MLVAGELNQNRQAGRSNSRHELAQFTLDIHTSDKLPYKYWHETKRWSRPILVGNDQLTPSFTNNPSQNKV